MQRAVDHSLVWSTDNGMKINTKKTQEMVVTFSPNSSLISSIPLLNTPEGPIQRCNSYKILGVFFNDKLTWDDHIDYILKKVAKRFFIIYALLRSGVSDSDITTVYCALIRSILEYACPVWHPGITIKQRNQIESVQKRFLKIIIPDTSYSNSLKISGLQSLFERRESICKKLFLEIKNPTHILHCLLVKRQQPVNFIRDFYPFEIPVGRTNRLKKSFFNFCTSRRF